MQETRRAPAIRFRADEFDRITALLGYDTDLKRAELLGCDPATVWRNRHGKGQPSSDFIARVAQALPRLPVTQFFDFGGTRGEAA